MSLGPRVTTGERSPSGVASSGAAAAGAIVFAARVGSFAVQPAPPVEPGTCGVNCGGTCGIFTTLAGEKTRPCCASAEADGTNGVGTISIDGKLRVELLATGVSSMPSIDEEFVGDFHAAGALDEVEFEDGTNVLTFEVGAALEKPLE